MHKILLRVKLVHEELQEIEKKICSGPVLLIQFSLLAVPLQVIYTSDKVDMSLHSDSLLVCNHIDL